MGWGLRIPVTGISWKRFLMLGMMFPWSTTVHYMVKLAALPFHSIELNYEVPLPDAQVIEPA